jgi:hypothetical protein
MKPAVYYILVLSFIAASCSKDESHDPLSQFAFSDSLCKISLIQCTNYHSDWLCGVFKGSPINYKFIYENDKLVAVSSDTTLDLNFVNSEPLIKKGYGTNNEIIDGFYYYSYSAKNLQEFYKFNYSNKEIKSYIHITEAAFTSKTEFYSVRTENNALRIKLDSTLQWGEGNCYKKISRTLILNKGIPVQIIDSTYDAAFGEVYYTYTKQMSYNEFGDIERLDFERNMHQLSIDSTGYLRTSLQYTSNNMINPLLYIQKVIGFPVIFDDELICNRKICRRVTGIDGDFSFANGKLIKQMENVIRVNANCYKLIYNYNGAENNMEMIIRTEPN